MDKIRQTPHGIFLQGTSRPIVVASDRLGTVVLRSPGDAARAFDLDIRDVITAADASATLDTRCGPTNFSWPPLNTVTRTWPNMPVVSGPLTPAAKPCTIHFQTPGRYGQAYDRDARSITATRRHLGLTETEFETLVHKLPGWRQICPPCVIGITVHAPGHVCSNPPLCPGDNGTDFFECRQLRNRIRLRLTHGHPQYFNNICDMPDFVIRNAHWIP